MSAPASHPAPMPETDASGRNLRLLMLLRWLAVGGQLLTIELVHNFMGIKLPLEPMLAAIALVSAINIAGLPLMRHRTEVTNSELTSMLLVDVAVLTWQLHFSGGLTNPFTSLFLLQVALGAILLKPASSWAILIATLFAMIVLTIDPVPLALPDAYRADPLSLYLKGSLVCFVMIAVLLVVFLTRVNRNLRNSDAVLAAIRQRAAEDDHIVRMGLLASGAAHELGTPLASLSVLIGDWRHLPQLAGDHELQEDLADMNAAVQRCKTIVSDILMSAGEARGIAPEITTMRTFLDGIVSDCRTAWRNVTLDYNDRFGTDTPIVADPALRKVIGNVIDNAAEASPQWIGIGATRVEEKLVLEVSDRGPGFAPEMLERFGQPYRSTKGQSGRGLGLFLLVNVLRQMGGQVEASNRLAGGATVRIVLPLSTLAYEGAPKK